MKTITFNNPPNNLCHQLRNLGLIDFYSKELQNEELKGKGFIYFESSNFRWGSGKNAKDSNDNKNKYFNEELNFWKSARIDLTDKGIEILKQSNLKGWK
jgi:hypothetical protein